MRKWKIQLEKFGISNARRDELIAFCRQYPEKVDKLEKAQISDPKIIEKYQRDIFIIEETAKEADSFLAPWIIQSVTKNIPSWKLVQNSMPATEKEFNAKRRRFYVLLSEKL